MSFRHAKDAEGEIIEMLRLFWFSLSNLILIDSLIGKKFISLKKTRNNNGFRNGHDSLISWINLVLSKLFIGVSLSFCVGWTVNYFS